jgi:hypothetical protein
MPNIPICRAALLWALASTFASAAGPASLPRFDHVVVVVEENKDYDQIIGNPAAPFVNQLAVEGANLIRMFGEEHNSEGNYFWLFSGDNQGVGFNDAVPAQPLKASSLGEQLVKAGFSFKGFAQALPAAGSVAELEPANCSFSDCVYGRKHVPWISFAAIPSAANLRFADFPSDFTTLPTVAFVMPDLNHDMHNGALSVSIPAGDKWLRDNLKRYYLWAKTHNSLLIMTFDESDNVTNILGPTDPAADPSLGRAQRVLQNHIPTVFAGAHVKPHYRSAQMANHVTILRTLEAIYGLPKSGAQAANALRAGITDDAVLADIFLSGR